MTKLKIRKATEADIPQLLPLMRELAEFEKYVICNHGRDITRTGISSITARFLLTGRGRKQHVGRDFGLLLRRIYLSREAEPNRQRALRGRIAPVQGSRQSSDESGCPRGGTHRLWHDQMVGREVEQARHRMLLTARRENRSRLARIPNVRRSVSRTAGSSRHPERSRGIPLCYL